MSELWGNAWRRWRRNRMAVLGAWVVGGLTLACIVGPPLLAVLVGYEYERQYLDVGAQPPSFAHPFGTDFFGRDLLTRVLTGGRVSLAVGLLAALVAGVIGTFYGAIAGWAGGRVDAVMMRVVDIIYALPYMFLVILLVTLFGKDLVLLFVALGCVGWLTTGRIVRGQVLGLKERDFILAARACGVGTTGILLRHLIPNTLGTVVVYFTLTVPAMILQEAFLSFLGLGVQAPRPSLGALINEGAQQMTVFWWQLVFPAAFMAALLLSLNFVGDGLRDALDPRAARVTRQP